MKVLFVHKYGEGDFEVERLWCTPVRDIIYIVDNIPFIAKNVALGDTITTEFDEEENEYYFDAFVEVSGNSTVRLYFEDHRLIDEVRKQMNEFGCESELFLQRKIVAINVPKLVNYKEIKCYLDNGEAKSLWDYEESCLAHDY